MIRVRYLVELPNDDRPTELPADTRAVMASAYAWCDIGQGGITTEEVSPDDVQATVVFPAGSELFVESSTATNCLDDTDDDSAARTRIWWRVVVDSP
jgi:hypothetical protein